MSASNQLAVAVRPLDLEHGPTVEALLALQRVAFRIEAETIGAETLPALGEDPEAVRRAGEVLGALDADGALLGALTWRRTSDVVEVQRLVVDPAAFRRGVATRLLDALDREHPDAERVFVEAAAANGPARALYERQGFLAVGERTVARGIVLVAYERRRAPAD